MMSQGLVYTGIHDAELSPLGVLTIDVIAQVLVLDVLVSRDDVALQGIARILTENPVTLGVQVYGHVLRLAGCQGH